jgi:signal transduction histidine kinase
LNTQGKALKTAISICLVAAYLTLWYVAAVFEYAPFASLWYAPAGLSVAILLLWKNDGFIKVWLCVFCVSILTQYSYFDNPATSRVLLVSVSAAFTHATPYWLAIKAFNKTQVILDSRSEGILLRPIVYAFYLLAGALGAALLGIVSQLAFADMSLDTARAIWLGWWLGDYVGVIILAPVFVFIGCKYFSARTEPENIFLIRHSQAKQFFPNEISLWCAWILVALLPSMIAIARVEVDARIPEVVAFLLVLLPIAILSVKSTWGVLVSATVSSSVLIIVTVKYFGVLGDAIGYQATLLAIAVTAMYFYDVVRNFESSAQELVEKERSLNTANRLLTLNAMGANIAHELSTPLQTALSASQRVRRRIEKMRGNWAIEIDGLNNVKDAIDQASNTVESVRSLAQAPQPSESQCTITEALQLAYKLATPVAKKHDVEIEINNLSGTASVGMEQSELTQILINLISNGIRGAAGTAERKVAVSVLDLDRLRTVIEVTDSGRGVEASEATRLFQFGHSSSSDRLGLGLWVSRSIAERRGCSLEYNFDDETNWCFRLTINRTEPRPS